MKRSMPAVRFDASVLAAAGMVVAGWGSAPSGAAAAGIVVQQNSAVNNVTVIQQRSPFHIHESAVTASSGGTTATEIIEIGPNPVPLRITQVGRINRAAIYQRGQSPNLDVQQSGWLNSLRSRQYTMP